MSTNDALQRQSPGRDGFIERGQQVTRLEAFVDAAFAFAVTLLVISIDTIPDSKAALVLALKAIPAFAVSFVMIALFWSAHARWSRRYGLDDGVSAVLSLTLVFLVMVYVYPLRLQFGVLFAWLSNGWLPSPFASAQDFDIGFMFVVYGLAFATLSACLMALYLHAWRRRDALGLGKEERAGTRAGIATFGYYTAVGLLSTVLAMLLPMRPSAWQASLPGMAYVLLSLTGLIARDVRRRALAAASHGQGGQA